MWAIRPVQQTHVVTEIEAMEEEMFLGLTQIKWCIRLFISRKVRKIT